ncbi:major capsid protein [Pseudanabaena phage Pam5]|nr:major capsid protein [Pseudanabaena phage Pam5]
MADTRVATGLTVEQWDEKYFVEYLTENRFANEMGTSESSIIQVKENLMKKPGDRVNFALVNRLTNDAITGTNTLEGNEEDMASRSFEVAVTKRRNGVRVAEQDEQFSAISLREAARSTLKDWSLKDTENLIIQSLASFNGTRYGSASEATKDAWLVDNADRVLFGALRSNNSSNDHSASLANCDTTADKLTAAAVSKMKTIAETVANPLIRPIRSTASKGRRYYILYAHPYAFNDLKGDTTITQAQREVNLAMENERLFEGGDLYWDGVIIKQIEQANTEWDFGLVGASSARVVGAYLCGAQAIGAAYAKRWTSKTQEFDYGDKYGVAIEAIYGIAKMQFGSGAADRDDLKDQGVVTGYFATSGLA